MVQPCEQGHFGAQSRAAYLRTRNRAAKARDEKVSVTFVILGTSSPESQVPNGSLFTSHARLKGEPARRLFAERRRNAIENLQDIIFTYQNWMKRILKAPRGIAFAMLLRLVHPLNFIASFGKRVDTFGTSMRYY